MRAKGYEVLFLYAHVDEFVMQHARKHKGFDLVSAEAADVDAWEEDADEKDASSKDEDASSSKDDSSSRDASSSKASEASSSAATLTSEEMSALCDWFATSALAGKVESVRPSTRLRASPALLTGHEPEAMRRYRAMLTMMADERTAKKLDDLRNAATLELNPRHAIVRGIERLRGSEDESERRLATLAAEQVFDNARASAGAMDDPREMVGRVHEILERALEREGTADAS
jgi:TNF receptor-associated protein 1